ncbi:O-antigen/teichoic acid export membrane protein [Paenibacillus sp. V4I9]|uniref:lipopolysaccharide biosynthesis protein n=1 Tax=Paenibacillus sp. V4I9 TaxID=3042308 RepID=UPI0027852394|nr:oligosaccharide flippase family protein [Paenibacillus sp. V4I9]MDQ0890884.1 O-antigen/teichoic acid export membrane protein [Paenibacillus sp. V4I9]
MIGTTALYGSVSHFLKRKDSLASSLKTVATSMLILLINMATGVVCARFLGPGGRGDQFVMILWPGFLAAMLTFGLPSALLYHMKKYPEKEGEFYVTALLQSLVLGLIALAIGMTFIPIWLDTYSSQVVRFAQWSMLLSPLALITLMNQSALQARGEFQLYDRLRSVPQMVTLLLLLILVLTNQMTAFASSLAYMLPVFPLTIWLMIRFLRIYGNQTMEFILSFRKLFHYGLSSYGIDVMGTLSMYMDQVIIVGLLSPSDLGLYVVSLSLARMIGILQSSLVTVLFPKAAGLAKEDAIQLTLRVFRISSFVTVIAALAVMLIAPYLLILLYGKQYEGGLAVFRLLLAEVVLAGGILVLAQAFMALGRPVMVSLLQVIGQGLTIPLLFVLVPKFGLIGAGYAMLISSVIRLIFILSNYPITLKVPLPQPFLTRADVHWLKEKLRKNTMSN